MDVKMMGFEVSIYLSEVEKVVGGRRKKSRGVVVESIKIGRAQPAALAPLD